MNGYIWQMGRQGLSARMKKKNRKHLQPILKDGIQCPGRDEEIRKVIRNLESSEGARPQVRED